MALTKVSSGLMKPDNNLELEYTSQLGTTSVVGAATGYVVRTNYYDANVTAGSGATFKFTGVTTLGKAGNVPNADGYFYDAVGRQFEVVGSPVSVLWFGAVGDGVTDDAAAVRAAFAVASGQIDFPKRTYVLDSRIEVTVSNLQVNGNGSTIDCTSITAGTYSGAFLWLTGNYNDIRDLNVLAPIVTVGSVLYLEGRIIRFIGDSNSISGCSISGGNGGAIRLEGNNNLVINNVLDQCNNRNGGGDYGSIEVRSGYGNKIQNNKITNFFYAGISAYGDNGAGAIVTGDITIENNEIVGSIATRTFTMGIFLLQGANKDIVISSNRISEIGNEGVVIFSDSLSWTENCLIRGNVFENVDYAGIFINSNSAGDGPHTVKSCIISDNIIKTTPALAASCFGIVLETAHQCQITGNIVEGPTSASFGVGIVVQLANTYENLVRGNVVRRYATGISFSGLRSTLESNVCYQSTKGIFYSSCESSAIVNNMANSCTTGFDSNTSANTMAVGNMASGCTTDFTGIGSSRNFYGVAQTAEGATRNYVNGTLVAGTANITFTSVTNGDLFIVSPTRNGGTVGNFGSMYIAYQDAGANLLTIKSTNVADDRPFVVIKIASAVIAS